MSRSFLGFAIFIGVSTLAFAAPKVKKEIPKYLAIQTGQQYHDYFGTTVTRQAKMLASPSKTYLWGVTNPGPQEMAYFGGTLLTDAKHKQRFRASIFIDSGIKAPLVFSFNAGDRKGETLESVTVNPGETAKVDFALNGAKAVFFSTELKIQHNKAERIILGEPEFE